MPSMHIDEELLARNSAGRVVVIAGGANGIGKALVGLFYNSGAHVVFSDWDKVNGVKLAQSLGSSTSNGSITFLQADVRDYSQQLAVFELAFEKNQTIDHAIYTVGIADPPGWMCASKLNLQSIKIKPVPLDDVLEVNLKGCLYFSRIAMTYMKEGNTANGPSPGTINKSLTLLSSASGFNEAPGLYAYASSKAGIIGMLRSFRSISLQNFGVRVNVVCPTACNTALIAKARDFIVAMGAPLSTTDGCGRIVQQLALDPSHHGEAVLVMADRGWDIEAGIESTRHQWLDDEAATMLEETQRKMGPNTDWADAHA